MTYIAILDTETSGLEADDIPVEVAAIIFDTQRKQPVTFLQSFLGYPEAPTKRSMCSTLTRIEEDYTRSFPSTAAFAELVAACHSGVISHLVAYNANFDRGFFEKACEQLGLDIPKTDWVCGKDGLPYHKLNVKPSRLAYTACDLGIQVPAALHRAMVDCQLLMEIIKKFEWAEVLAYAAMPVTRLVAQTTFAQNDLVKQHGFKWHPENRYWHKDVRGDVPQFPFPIDVLE